MTARKLSEWLASAVVLLVFTVTGLLGAPCVQAQPSADSILKDNEELARLYQEDQSDRMPADGRAIDWKVVGPRDNAREARAKELYAAGQVQTGADCYHVAMILQHASTPEDCLLAHELCVVAIMKGEERAKWLAAASEDRFLMKIGRPQRFGTQYRSDGPGTLLLYQTDSSVTDQLRHWLDVPPLADAKLKEQKPADSGK